MLLSFFHFGLNSEKNKNKKQCHPLVLKHRGFSIYTSLHFTLYTFFKLTTFSLSQISVVIFIQHLTHYLRITFHYQHHIQS